MELEKLDNLNLGKSMLYLQRKKFLQARAYVGKQY